MGDDVILLGRAGIRTGRKFSLFDAEEIRGRFRLQIRENAGTERFCIPNSSAFRIGK